MAYNFHLPLAWVQSIAMSMSLSVCPLPCLKKHASRLHEIMCTLSVAVARPSSDDSAIRYVLPVLCMTSCGKWLRWCIKWLTRGQNGFDTATNRSKACAVAQQVAVRGVKSWCLPLPCNCCKQAVWSHWQSCVVVHLGNGATNRRLIGSYVWPTKVLFDDLQRYFSHGKAFLIRDIALESAVKTQSTNRLPVAKISCNCCRRGVQFCRLSVVTQIRINLTDFQLHGVWCDPWSSVTTESVVATLPCNNSLTQLLQQCT